MASARRILVALGAFLLVPAATQAQQLVPFTIPEDDYALFDAPFSVPIIPDAPASTPEPAPAPTIDVTPEDDVPATSAAAPIDYTDDYYDELESPFGKVGGLGKVGGISGATGQ